jgi:transcriptional regulator with XRE-family HTH domain
MERRDAGRRPMAARQPSVAVMVPEVSFGGLLRAHRERALLSQEQLAERAGLSARTIRELEAGRVRRPRGTSVRLLAQALRLRGSLRQAFEAAARTHPPAQTGDPVRRGGDEGGRAPTGGAGVLAEQPPSEGAGGRNPSLLVPSLYDWFTAASSGALSPNPMSFHTGGLPLDGLPADLRGSRVLLVVAVATEVVVWRDGRCRVCGSLETG